MRLNRYEFQMCAAGVVNVVDMLQETSPGTHLLMASFTDFGAASELCDAMNLAFWQAENLRLQAGSG